MLFSNSRNRWLELKLTKYVYVGSHFCSGQLKPSHNLTIAINNVRKKPLWVSWLCCPVILGIKPIRLLFSKYKYSQKNYLRVICKNLRSLTGSKSQIFKWEREGFQNIVTIQNSARWNQVTAKKLGVLETEQDGAIMSFTNLSSFCKTARFFAIDSSDTQYPWP